MIIIRATPCGFNTRYISEKNLSGSFTYGKTEKQFIKSKESFTKGKKVPEEKISGIIFAFLNLSDGKSIPK